MGLSRVVRAQGFVGEIRREEDCRDRPESVRLRMVMLCMELYSRYEVCYNAEHGGWE
jgi:hypothetical protein